MTRIALRSTRLDKNFGAALGQHVTTSERLHSQHHQHVYCSQLRGRMSAGSTTATPGRPHQSTVALGSNIGDRVSHIESALQLMKKRAINVVQTSPLYETKPMYYEDQNPFVNGVCEVSTDQEPLVLLNTLQSIERDLGRERSIAKGPRTIDLDVVSYGESRMDARRLILPHPGLAERDFVLRPLNDILPQLRIPVEEHDDWTFCTVARLFSQLQHRDDSMSPITQLSSKLPLLRSADPARPTQIMAILNLTPDSFSDGGLHDATNIEIMRSTILDFIGSGATIIDIGGQSTRPGAKQLSPNEELERIHPAIKLIRSMPEAKSTAISIDTFHASVAKEALAAGADIINDISGGTLSNNEILKVVAEAGKTIVLMHMRGDPTSMNQLAKYPQGVVATVAEELRVCVDAALSAGIPPWRIVLDPGIGFAKNMNHNLTLLNRLADLRASALLAGYPWLLGTSRKGFIGKITGVENASERVMGTAATVTASVAGGADIVRVHDVRAMAEVVRMSDAIYRQASDVQNKEGAQ